VSMSASLGYVKSYWEKYAGKSTGDRKYFLFFIITAQLSKSKRAWRV
jgi:hypothetical protein